MRNHSTGDGILLATLTLLWMAAALGATPQRAWAQPALLDPSDPQELIPPAIELPAPSETRSYPARPIPPRPSPELIPTPPAPHPPRSGQALSPPGAVAPKPSVVAGPAYDPLIYLGPPPPTRQELPPEIPRNAEKWRYMWHDGAIWYYQPSGRWSYWSAGRWVEYSPSRYATKPPNQPPATRRFGGGLRTWPAAAYPPPTAYDPSSPYGGY
jgi:hypothetical protein